MKGIEFEIPDEEKSPGENRIRRGRSKGRKGKGQFFGVEWTGEGKRNKN